MALFDHDGPIDWAEIVTYDAAVELNPSTVAQHWADPGCWRLERSARDELGELACMAALARWLTGWQPIKIHRALLKGASAQEVAAAFGGSVEETGRAWYRLLSSARQRRTAPTLAYGLLALGIGATLAANVAHGLAHGPAGAAVAAWPAVSLVGSYELLMVIIRNASQPVPPRADDERDRATSEPPTLTGYDAALTAYRASVATGQPTSARQLAVRHAISRRQAGQIVATVTRQANGFD